MTITFVTDKLISQNGNTALLVTSQAGKVDVANLLLAAGADIGLQNKVGTAAQHAIDGLRCYLAVNIAHLSKGTQSPK